MTREEAQIILASMTRSASLLRHMRTVELVMEACAVNLNEDVESVIKKLKDRSFAAKVERDEVYKGVELLGVSLENHIAFIIDVLRKNKEELGI